jgi:hypothetical protein
VRYEREKEEKRTVSCCWFVSCGCFNVRRGRGRGGIHTEAGCVEKPFVEENGCIGEEDPVSTPVSKFLIAFVLFWYSYRIYSDE